MMKNIELLANFDSTEIGKTEKTGQAKEVKKLFDGARRQILSIKLYDGEILSKHQAKEPITVLCLAGSGTFRAGKNLEDEQKLVAGTLITLEPEIEHEVAAEPAIHVLVTKFKNE